MDRFVNDLVDRFTFQLSVRGAETMGFDYFHLRDPIVDQYAIPQASLPRDIPPSEAPPLCGACDNITMEALESPAGYLHSEDLESFARSAENCPLCALLLRQMCTAVKYHIQSDEEITDAETAAELFASYMADQHLFMLHPAPVILRLDRTSPTAGAQYIATGTPLLEVLSEDAAPELKLGLFWGRLLLHDDDGGESVEPLRPRGTDEDVLARLAAWLREREAEVPAWSAAGGDRRLPTRVLDLACFAGDDDSAQPDTGASDEADVRLIEPAAGQCGRYVTLSYCWGGYMEWRTLKTNLAERLERIPFALLPDTFAQAIRVTRGLGVRYLWIDALCIIQDDLEDWRREAASMCDVYWNTVCRLAVSDSRRPTEGFFPPAPILASVRVPGLEAGGKGQRMDEDDLYSPMAGQDGGEGEEIEASGANVIPTPSGRTGHMEGEASEKIPAYHVDDNMSSETWWMPSPQGPDASDSHAPPDDTTEFLAMFASKVQEEASEEIPAYHVNDNVNETSRTPPDDINEFLAMFANKAQEENNQDREQKQESQHHALVKKYLTLPRAYAIDVDRAHLNTRGWVLQERLLSPRSIHFTKHQIYCEDQDDICGEDWIRRYFTWRSSVDKASTFTPVELFPERRFNSADRMRENFSAQDNIWSQRATLRRADNHYVADPWLRICERFSESRLTFDTDRLAAIAGLVKKKQELARSESANATATATANNFLGLWEESLHVELAWVARGDGKLKFLRSLGLPSWAWIAYEGCIRFTKESRHFRDPRMMRVPPVAEIQIVEADVPDMTAPLPLEKPASLTVDATVRKIHGISAESTENDTAREEVEAPSPFHLDPESRAAPVPLSALSVCREILDSDEQVVGFVSFDEDEDIRDTVDMFCAQISTLVYEQRPESWNEPMTPVLAYGLVLVKVEESDSEYRRVGLAQVNHGWMTSGTRERVKLV